MANGRTLVFKRGRREYYRVMAKGHPRADKDGYVLEHLLIAEEALGKYLPNNAVVHHHTQEQLVICENHAYHMLLHQRERAIKSCSNPNLRKCSICHVYDSENNLVRAIGRQHYHVACKKAYMADYDKKRVKGKSCAAINTKRPLKGARCKCPGHIQHEGRWLCITHYRQSLRNGGI